MTNRGETATTKKLGIRIIPRVGIRIPKLIGGEREGNFSQNQRLKLRAADKGGLRRPSRDSVPLTNSTFWFFLPNPALVANACRSLPRPAP